MKRFRLPSLLVLVLSASLVSTAAAQESVEWSYEGATGPEHWADLSPAFRACGEGSRQSPIDLADATRRHADKIRTDYTPSAVSLLHNGETVEVRSDLAQTLTVGASSYSLVQMHFHSPAEHSVAERIGPLELHFVHQAADGSRAVLGALVRTGHRNRELDLLLRALPRVKGAQTRVAVPVDLERLLPGSRIAYRYAGSLTTPPCTEGISWMVLAKPLRVSRAQIAELREVVEGNARPTQARNGRPLILG